MARKMGLNDELNLKGLILHITSVFKDNDNLIGPDTAAKFLETLIQGIEKVDVSKYSFLQDGVKPRKRGKNKKDHSKYSPPKVADIQKALSGNVTLDKLELFSKLVQLGAYNEVFKKNIRPLVLEMERNDHIDDFCDSTDQMISPRYFTAEEYSSLHLASDVKDYTAYILVLLRHSFSHLENIPAYYAQRVYEQAQTFDYDSPSRYALMREAADNGIVQACIELGNYLAKRDDYTKPLSDEEVLKFEEALHYFLIAREYDPALWNIGFILGNYNIPKKTVSHINQVLRVNSKIKNLDPAIVANELEVIKPSPYIENPSAVILAYKIQFYLAFKKDRFAKSLNSMGNMLYTRKVLVDETSAQISAKYLINKYRNLAADGQDLFAITNRGSEWIKKILNNDGIIVLNPEESAANMQLLYVSANAKMKRGLYNLAVAEYYLLTSGIINSENAKLFGVSAPLEISTVKKHLLEALKENQENSQLEGELYYRLGALESPINEAERLEFFTKAAACGQADAVYELSLRQYLRDRDDYIALDRIRADLYLALEQMSEKKEAALELIHQIDRRLLSHAATPAP